MKKTIIVIITAILVCLVVGFFFFQANYVMVDWNVISRSATQVDLQDTDLTAEQYQQLQQKLPDCQIIWSVPFQGQHYASNTTSLHTSQLTQADIALLAYFPDLAQLDATDCTDLEVIRAVRETYPQLSVKYWVPLDGKTVPQDATALTLGSGTAAELAQALSYLPDVKDVDASGCRDYAALQALQAQYPQCNIRYTVAIGNDEVADTIASLAIQDPDISELEAVLPYLSQLETVELTGALPANEEIHKLQVAYPDVDFIWNFTLCGVEVSTMDSIVELSNIRMSSTQEVESALPYFNKLERVIMCDCGISNEDMDALGKRNPETRFVWTVSIGPKVRLRTDATYFMPYQYGAYMDNSQVANLKYCIDLICIDLGHMGVTDVSFLRYMPHMKYLIIAISPVSDISPLAGLQELEYAELFYTKIQDYTPLLSCPNLKDLNICYATPPDISVISQLTQLETLYIKEWTPRTYIPELQAALPNTRIVSVSRESCSSTADGWRELPRYYEMRDILGMPYFKG